MNILRCPYDTGFLFVAYLGLVAPRNRTLGPENGRRAGVNMLAGEMTERLSFDHTSTSCGSSK